MSTEQQKKSRALGDGAFRSARRNPPARVLAVERKHGKEAADKMIAGIALNTARKQGAKIKK